MSANLVAANSIWRVNIGLTPTGHSRHPHKRYPISTGFTPPEANRSLVLSPVALAGAIARTATLRNAPPDMLARWGQSALAEIEYLVTNTPTFTLSNHINSLADAERTAFAARVGAGVTDLVMNGLGYTWRDNAMVVDAELDRRADFLYGDGAVSGHGVVLAEAHGSFAANTTAASITNRARRKYLDQVKRNLEKSSPYGKVIHGYSIAFGSKPLSTGAFLHIAETRIPRPQSKVPPDADTSAANAEHVATTLALATQRSNFALMESPTIVEWIDWLQTGGAPPDHASTVFFRIPYAGRVFLAATDWVWHMEDYFHYVDSFAFAHVLPRRYLRHGFGRQGFAGWFVMEESAAERFLNALTASIRGGPEELPTELTLPRFEPVGFLHQDDGEEIASFREDYTYAMFRDGLALLGTPPQRTIGAKIWLPKEGVKAL